MTDGDPGAEYLGAFCDFFGKKPFRSHLEHFYSYLKELIL